MKRALTDVLRRGFDNAVANWPLVLIRVAETAVLLAIGIGAVVAVIIPLVVSAHIGGWQNIQADPDAMFETIVAIVTEHWLLILYILGVACAVLTIGLAIHAAVDAGSARVYVDGERAASISRTTAYVRYEAFTMDRFLAGVRAGWWRVFWIYNIAWLEAGLVLLAPLALGAALMALIGANAAAIALGCFLLLAMLLLFFVVALLTGVWVNKAIVITAASEDGASEALRHSRRRIGADLARHVALALIVMAISLVGTGTVSSFSSLMPAHGTRSMDGLLFLYSPFVIGSSLLSTLFSASVGQWFLACLAAIQQETPA